MERDQIPKVPELLDRSAYKRRMNAALTVDPRRTAVLTIDMQRKYLDEAVGESVVLPDEADRVIKSSKRLLDAARSLSMPVVHAYVARRPEEQHEHFHAGGLAYLRTTTELAESQLPHRKSRYRPDRPAGTPQAEVPAILTAPTDVHVTAKKTLDSFQHTDLAFLLREALDVDTVVLMGINTDTCVYSTTFTAANLGFKPIVVSDCVASMRGKDSHWMALELMSRSVAWVLALDDLMDKINEAGARPARPHP
ncbi:MAG: isochorismatase family protein [Chloroflexi bacterium]|nr:isochorismatase family protein [Chloroflexota bacterium]